MGSIFREFVCGCVRELINNGVDWDSHYTPLSEILQLKSIHYDCVLRLEFLEDDQDRLKNILSERGVGLQDFNAFSRFNTSKSGTTVDLVGRYSLEDEVRKLSEQNFQLLNYT